MGHLEGTQQNLEHPMTSPVTIINDCCLSALRKLPTESVDAIITSPPYWVLRDYGIEPTDWPACSYRPMPGLDPVEIPAETSVLGLEPTLSAFVGHIVLIFEECRRVLKPTGSLWMNMGDSYNNSGLSGGTQVAKSKGQLVHRGAIGKGSTKADSLKPKDLMGQPWRLAFALQAAGWYLRMDNIWHKPNPMPESTTDRATKSHEYVFHFTKAERYYFDTAAWAEPCSLNTNPRRAANGTKMPDGWDTGKGGHGSFHRNGREKGKVSKAGSGIKYNASFADAVADLVTTRNKRSVWTVPTEGYAEAHYATYPTRLIAPPLLASTSARGVCATCGAPWTRGREKTGHQNARKQSHFPAAKTQTSSVGCAPATRSTNTWAPTCSCGHGETAPAVVLDPFGGSGTTGQVALEHGRRAILIERGPHNVELIHRRLAPVLESPTLQLV